MADDGLPKALSDDDLAAVSGGAGPAPGGPGSERDDLMNALVAMQADRLAALDGQIAEQRNAIQQNSDDSALLSKAAETLRKGFDDGATGFKVDTVIEGPRTSYVTQERSVLGTLHEAVNALDLDPAKAGAMLQDGRIDKAEGSEIIGLAEAKTQQLQDQFLLDVTRLKRLEDSRDAAGALTESLMKGKEMPKFPR